MELPHFVAPDGPVGAFLSPKQLEIGAGYEPFDALMDAIWLSAMLAARFNNCLPDTGV
jgi:hypothetical protein